MSQCNSCGGDCKKSGLERENVGRAKVLVDLLRDTLAVMDTIEDHDAPEGNLYELKQRIQRVLEFYHEL